MVNGGVTGDPERALALSYAPADRRAALATLFALDARLRRIARAARDPTIGLMRLIWWRDALERLDTTAPPAEPLLQALAAEVLPLGVSGAALAGMVAGWERLLEPVPVAATIAAETGGRLFALAARLLGGDDRRVAEAGTAWALVELMRFRPELVDADDRVSASNRLAAVFDRPWPRTLRPLGALALLARADLDAKSRPGSPRRVARLLAHRLTGR